MALIDQPVSHSLVWQLRLYLQDFQRNTGYYGGDTIESADNKLQAIMSVII